MAVYFFIMETSFGATVKVQPSTNGTGNEDTRKFYTGRELLEMNIKEVPKLWEPYIPSTGISILAGPSDCGKSTMLRQLALSICRGDETFLGTPLNAKYQRAIVVSTEDDANSVAASISKQVSKSDFEHLNKLQFIFDQENPIESIKQRFTKGYGDLIIVDSLGDILNSGPNDFTAVRKVLNAWKALSLKYNCAVLFLHHLVKNSDKVAPDKNRLNGSQGIEAKARTVLELRQGSEPNQRMLSVLKANYMSNEEKQRTLILDFDSSTLTFNSTRSTIDKSEITGIAIKKYDPKLAEEAARVRRDANFSFQQLRDYYVEKLGEETTPSLTWFKENCKG
jgi:RecA-family ATPase